MAAPQHQVFLLPLTLLHSGKKVRELAAMLRDYRNTDFGRGFSSSRPRYVPFPDLPDGFIDISPDVYAINTQKALALTSAGTFNLSIVDRRRFGLAWSTSRPLVPYTVNIQPNDLLIIRLNAGGQNDLYEVVMIGVVERIYKRTGVSDNRVSHSVGVYGYDLTHWLHEHRNFFWLYALGAEKQTGIQELRRRVGSDLNTLKHYLPAEGAELAADRVIEQVFKGRSDPQSQTDPEKGFITAQFPRVNEMFAYNPIGTQSKRAHHSGLTEGFPGGSLFGFGERYIPEETLDAFYGGVVNILNAYSFSPFCEMWCDVDDLGVYKLHHRRCPFDKEDWDALETHLIHDDIITRMDVGRALHDLTNFVSVVPRLFGAGEQDLFRLTMPTTFRLDWSRILDVGLRPMSLTPRYLEGFARNGETTIVQQQSSFNDMLKGSTPLNSSSGTKRQRLTQQPQAVQQFLNGKGRLARLADSWAQVIWDWHVEHPRFWTGRVTFQGKPNVRVGQRIQLSSSSHKHFDQDMVLYVVGVSHEYSVQDRYTTTVIVSRGQPLESFVAPVTTGKEDIPEAEKARASGIVETTFAIVSVEVFLP